MNLYRRQIRERTAHRIRWNKCAASGVLYLQALVRATIAGNSMRTDSDSKLRVFDRTTRMMHWLNAGLMLFVFALAFSIDLATSRASHTAFLQLHRSVGLSVWVLTMVRLLWRHFAKYPDWPPDTTQTMRIAAMASEYALYALLLAQPILGFLQTSANGDHVYLFFIGQLPALVEKNRPLAHQLFIVHKSVGFTLLGLIVVHVSAALSHHFLRRDDTLTAMLPAASRWRPVGSRADQARGADAPQLVPSVNSSARSQI